MSSGIVNLYIWSFSSVVWPLCIYSLVSQWFHLGFEFIIIDTICPINSSCSLLRFCSFTKYNVFPVCNSYTDKINFLSCLFDSFKLRIKRVLMTSWLLILFICICNNKCLLLMPSKQIHLNLNFPST